MYYNFKVKEIIYIAIDVKIKNFDKNIQTQLDELNEIFFIINRKESTQFYTLI